ncbi:MAG: ribosomal protein S18-alanine N-acetyltransferase [candidate division WOR-3 bacterium]|nr:ribosomal protein S18-alanine N-acetyltransferase [candidate division WOR-3 bacterium]
MKIVPMQVKDLNQVMKIENESFAFPWKRSFFEYDLRRPNGYVFVAKQDDIVLGYLDAWQIDDEMHLANIAVAPNYRQQGIASKMLLKLIEIAKKKNIKSIYLEVRVSNKIARKLYEKFGFVNVYTRKNYYPDGEDAIIYKKSL